MSQVASRCMHRLEEHIRLPCGARYDTGKEAHDWSLMPTSSLRMSRNQWGQMDRRQHQPRGRHDEGEALLSSEESYRHQQATPSRWGTSCNCSVVNFRWIAIPSAITIVGSEVVLKGLKIAVLILCREGYQVRYVKGLPFTIGYLCFKDYIENGSRLTFPIGTYPAWTSCMTHEKSLT